MNRLFCWCSFLLVMTLASCNRPVPMLPEAPERTESWSRALIDDLSAVPVQHDGRVKPLSTWAAFALYFVHGRRDLKFAWQGADGAMQKASLEPTEWLLDVWCYPRQAAQYPLFRIENASVLDALGIANDGQRQDFEYLSYQQVYRVGDKLQELWRNYTRIDQKERSPVQEHIVQLWRKAMTYQDLQGQLGAFYFPLAIPGAELQQAVGGEQVYLGEVLSHAGAVREVLRKAEPSLESDANDSVLRFGQLLSDVIANDRDGARLLPPVDSADQKEVWHTLGEGVDLVLRGAEGVTLAALLRLQDVCRSETHAARETALRAYRDAVLTVAESRADSRKVALENTYYRQNWHYQSIHWFLLGFVLAAICWLAPKNRTLWFLSLGASLLALGMLGYDLVLRCLITERPPIKNLYDTFLFIAAVGVLLTLIVEWVLPRRIALAAAPVLGALLVMFARMFEVSKGEDTMAPLVAVLDSNFWLATHVTSINIGYAAGLVAAVLANVWIAMRVLRLAHPAEPAAKAVVRMTYGVTCFALAFAVVGTILGGVWANDSWGRFWGWDPKENGALMICLSQIALLHARMSGWVRDFGFMAWSAITGMVVVFSWFHVNLLGVGLHSYGFSSGLRDAVWWCYVTQGMFVFVGAIDVLLRPNPAPIVRATKAPLAAPAQG